MPTAPVAAAPAPTAPARPDAAERPLHRSGFPRFLILSLARLWMSTWRLRWHSSPPASGPGILVLWHEHLPACIPAFARRGIGVLVSRSADGALAAEACRRLGYRVYRGSDSAGSLSGMKALARGLRDGGGLAGMALDGPRGPRRVPKPGTLWLSELAGAPLLPIAVKASRALRLKTWDHCLLPLPFATVEVRVGAPCRPADAEALCALMEENQSRLDSP